MLNFNIEFYSKNNQINPDLIGEKTMQLASEIKNSGESYTKIRSFYGECLSYKNLEFEDIEIRLKLLKSKVYYEKGRRTIRQLLFEFLNDRIDNIKNKDDFNYFLMHYEALLGYFKYFDENIDKNK